MTAAAAMAALPRGRTLPEEVWLRRHRWMTLLVWSQAIMLTTYGLIAGQGIPHSLLEGVPVATCALIAGAGGLPRRARTGAVAIGLLTSSAVLVHLMEGRIEAHFHFFVMVTILATYEEWFPYLMGVGYVVLHHGIAGGLVPASVYDHPAAIEQPWKWAGVHAILITALGAANILGWPSMKRSGSRCAAPRDASAAPSTRLRSAWRSSHRPDASCRRHSQRRAVPPLPAGDRAGERARRGRRGPASLGAPRVRASRARPLHPARGADGTDRSHRRMGDRRGMPPAERVGNG